MNLVAISLVGAALVILVAALPPARKLVAELPEGPMRAQWRLLGGMIFLLLPGYAAYVALIWDRHAIFADLLAPVLFICSAGCMWLAVRLSLATVSNVRHMATLERANVTDALSGLDSRHYLDRRMHEEIMRAQRHGLAVSVMLLDIDEFASINATYGHAVGDQVLTEIGRILTGGVRESDVLVRYGGEEIAVVATHTPPEAALAVAERLRRDVEIGARKALLEAQGARRAITVSIGVAGREAGAPATGDLFALAEQALRRAKSEGRNRVVLGSA
ncbi:MAG: GGDEF domain-containing protein [Betaproteobacteria bacterium]|nr:GGDEF domain-containing protein [Betaproteobacteria bacterium]